MNQQQLNQRAEKLVAFSERNARKILDGLMGEADEKAREGDLQAASLLVQRAATMQSYAYGVEYGIRLMQGVGAAEDYLKGVRPSDDA